MKTSFVALMVSSMLLQLWMVDAYGMIRYCKPGQRFTANDGCNTCICPPDGLKENAACTLMACTSLEECTPGQSFLADDGCNHCRCPPSGWKDRASCTRMRCPKPDDLPEDLSEDLPEEQCTPGESFPADDGCNSCICPSTGLKESAGCTKMACPNLNELTEGQCIPGESFPADDGCNQCSCPLTGLKEDAACTAMACISQDQD